ncbi:hypothetical protein IKS86_04450 [bacterium]|nr:hypothetical protein [bacterium]
MPFTWDDALQFVKNLGDVCKSILMNIYNMVYSDTPQDVTVKYIDNTDHVQETTVPNWAKMNAQFETWKGTVQPQINAINRQMGWNGGYNSKEVFDLTNDVFDPNVASAMSGGYYGGYEFYSPQILGSNSVEFFEVEINNKISNHRPFYSRAILRIETDADGEVTYKGVQQLDKCTNTTGVIGIGRCQDSSFTMLFGLQGGSTPITTSDIPDIQDYYCRIRKLDNSLYS